MELTVTQQERPLGPALLETCFMARKGVFAYLALIPLTFSVVGLNPLPRCRASKFVGMTLLSIAFGGSRHHGLLSPHVGTHRRVKTNSFRRAISDFLGGSLKRPPVIPPSWGRLSSPCTIAVTGHLPRTSPVPKQGGFWWAHLRWLYQTQPRR